jgi:two-component system sensor histidine kinase ChvG
MLKNRRLSNLTLRILAINTLAIAILFGGVLYLNRYESSLIQSELEALSQQASLFSHAIGETAAENDRDAGHLLARKLVRRIINRSALGLTTRSRVFNIQGELLADSLTLSGRVDAVETKPLAPPSSDLIFQSIAEELYEHIFSMLPSRQKRPIYRETTLQLASEFPEVLQAIQGIAIKTVRATESGGLILTVAVPIQKYKQVVGALLLSIAGKKIETSVKAVRLEIIAILIIVSSVTLLLSLYLAGTITRPIQRLAAAAELIKNGLDRKNLIPDLSDRNDEIGDLARAMRQMTDDLWDRMDAIERFAADVSHEIKNPLTSIKSAVETASKIYEESKRDKLFSLILDDVTRLDRLVSDISAASRLDSELSRETYEIIDAEQLLTTFYKILLSTKKFTSDNLLLKIKNDNNSCTIFGHEDRLVQVIRNLIDNAETFSSADGQITIHCEANQSHVIINIDDMGVGVPDSKLETIFDRFYSERPTNEKFGTHSGLGLSICKQIVDAHEGKIWAENLYNLNGKKSGAKFCIALPCFTKKTYLTSH